jgi:MoaA/NifB/PqqE/SkfB family radical SAM enzyme
MFKFEELIDIHLEITSNCQASCPMCPRNFHGGLPNPHLTISTWTLDDFKKIFNNEVLFQIRGFYFCGNFGDPMLNDNLIDMIDYAAKINPEVAIRVHTNGGARKEEWWRRLARVMPKNHDVHFAIDGLEDTHHLYRIGTTYDTVMRNARAFIDEGGHAVWTFIKFKHNQYQAEEAEQRAKDYGFIKFILKASNRFVGAPKFDVYDKNGEITHYLEPAVDSVNKYIDKEFIPKIKEYVEDTKISCTALNKKEIYIK